MTDCGRMTKDLCYMESWNVIISFIHVEIKIGSDHQRYITKTKTQDSWHAVVPTQCLCDELSYLHWLAT